MFAVLHSDINSPKSGLLHLTSQPNCKKNRSAKVKDGIINLILRNYLVDRYSLSQVLQWLLWMLWLLMWVLLWSPFEASVAAAVDAVVIVAVVPVVATGVAAAVTGPAVYTVQLP